MEDIKSSKPKPKSSLRDKIKKLGFVAFLFFLIKGLLWLIVPAVLIYFGVNVEW